MFSATELTGMRAAQTGHMMDTCVIQAYSRTFSDMKAPVETWTDSTSTTACGLDMRPGDERHGVQNSIVEYDATIRLPIATVIDAKDRIKVTKRFGETLGTALVFQVAGPIQRGPSGIRIRLKRVEV